MRPNQEVCFTTKKKSPVWLFSSILESEDFSVPPIGTNVITGL